jgi:hypothetical protein
VLQRAGWALPRPFLYIREFFKLKKLFNDAVSNDRATDEPLIEIIRKDAFVAPSRHPDAFLEILRKTMEDAQSGESVFQLRIDPSTSE